MLRISGRSQQIVRRREIDPIAGADLQHRPQRLGIEPAANVAKMSAGIPLTDEDRRPWLDAIGKAIHDATPDNIVVACSALKRMYLERIVAAAGRPVRFIFLDGQVATLRKRIGGRRGHFMPASLLDSQLATLERPDADEQAVTVSIEAPIRDVVTKALDAVEALQA